MKQTPILLGPTPALSRELKRMVAALERIATALETPIDKKKRTVRTVDVDRSKVYKTHLGKKLKK